ncbi:MAG TPA: D-glycerate dehydrogenase [Bacteroidetes bacterium]|nr:D-glycerate dehydrogenase [Bacteroidota bacterium]
MHKILITEQIDQRAIDFLSEQGFEISVGTRGKLNTEDALIEALHDCDGAITMLSNPISRRVMESCPNVKVFANYAVGFNNVDVIAAKELGVRVSNTPDVLSEATADIALSLLLGVSRKIVEAESDLRKGKFDGWHPNGYVGVELFGKKAGMIGMGRIGKAIVRRLKGFGITTLYHNRNRIDIQTEQNLDATFTADLDEMLTNIDFLFLSCPLTPETHHIINASRLSKLDPKVIIINTGRGPLIDEAALAESLIDGKLAGAGLDVFEREPEIHPLLLKAPNTLLLPHIGSATRETRFNMAMLCANSVLKILRGENPNLISNLIA